MSTHSDVQHLIKFIESICDEVMMAEHKLTGPIARLKPPLIQVDGFSRSDPEHPDWIELSKKEDDHARSDPYIGDCEVCGQSIDRYSPWFDGAINGALIHLCNNCAMSHTDTELAELGIIMDEGI